MLIFEHAHVNHSNRLLSPHALQVRNIGTMLNSKMEMTTPATMEIKKRPPRMKWGPALNQSDTTVAAGNLSKTAMATAVPAVTAATAVSSSSSSSASRSNAIKRNMVCDANEITTPELCRFPKKKSKMIIKTVISTSDLTSLSEPSAMEDTSMSTAICGETDAKGFYKSKISEIFDNKYRVMSILGEGAFAEVVRVVSIEDESKLFAIKVFLR